MDVFKRLKSVSVSYCDREAMAVISDSVGAMIIGRENARYHSRCKQGV
jgi:hypothetical protein